MTTAIAYTEFGGPEVLHEIPAPERAPDARLGRDPRRGGWREPDRRETAPEARPSGEIAEPRRVGGDGAGVVDRRRRRGGRIPRRRPGRLRGRLGAYATELVVAADRVFVRPPRVSAAEGAALASPSAPRIQTLRSLGVGSGDTLLVHGGSGAVGQALIQFAVLRGATVIATSSERRFDRVRALGAVPLTYGDGLADRVREVAPHGVTVAIDAAGTDEALQTSIELVPDRQRVATLVRGRMPRASASARSRAGLPCRSPRSSRCGATEAVAGGDRPDGRGAAASAGAWDLRSHWRTRPVAAWRGRGGRRRQGDARPVVALASAVTDGATVRHTTGVGGRPWPDNGSHAFTTSTCCGRRARLLRRAFATAQVQAGFDPGIAENTAVPDPPVQRVRVPLPSEARSVRPSPRGQHLQSRGQLGCARVREARAEA